MYYLRILVVLQLLYTDLDAVSLEITPSASFQPGTTALTMRCSLAGDQIVTQVRSLKINKLASFLISKRSVSTNVKSDLLASISAGGSATLGSNLTEPKYMVTGSLTSTTNLSGAFLQIVIKDPDCNEQSAFQCQADADNNQGTISPSPEETKNVHMQRDPENLTIQVTPDKSMYKVNETVTMKCAGDVGNIRKRWDWMWKRPEDSTGWIKYPVSGDVQDGVIHMPTAPKCSFTQDTTLTYVIKMGDNGLEIRCILGNMETYSVTRTFSIPGDTETTTTKSTNCSGHVIINIMLICLMLMFTIFGKN